MFSLSPAPVVEWVRWGVLNTLRRGRSWLGGEGTKEGGAIEQKCEGVVFARQILVILSKYSEWVARLGGCRGGGVGVWFSQIRARHVINSDVNTIVTIHNYWYVHTYIYVYKKQTKVDCTVAFPHVLLHTEEDAIWKGGEGWWRVVKGGGVISSSSRINHKTEG